MTWPSLSLNLFCVPLHPSSLTGAAEPGFWRSAWGPTVSPGWFHKTSRIFLPFFFPPAWPIRTRHGPYNSVSGEKAFRKRTRVVQKRGQIISSTQTNNQKKRNQNDPQIPQPDLRFAIKQTAKQQRTGPGPNKNQTKQLEICLEYSDLSHCIVIKNMQTN